MNKSIKKIAKLYSNNLSSNKLSTVAYNDTENEDELEDPKMWDASKIACKLSKIAELYENDKEETAIEKTDTKNLDSFEDED